MGSPYVIFHSTTPCCFLFQTRERPPDLPPKPSNSAVLRGRDVWSPGDLSSTPVNEVKFNVVFDNSRTHSTDRPLSVSFSHQENSPKANWTGSLARKIVVAPRSYRGVTKKWLPIEQPAGYNWAVLEGTRLSFYENDGGKVPAKLVAIFAMSDEMTWKLFCAFAYQ